MTNKAFNNIWSNLFYKIIYLNKILVNKYKYLINNKFKAINSNIKSLL